MIVVTTSGSSDVIFEFLDKYHYLRYYKHSLAVVVNGGKPDFLKRLRDESGEDFILCNGYGQYDFGTVLYALDFLDADSYTFIQDSCLPVSCAGMDKLAYCAEGEATAWASFEGMFDSASQEKWCEDIAGSVEFEWGIFGPIFSATRLDLERIVELRDIVVDNKDKQQAMERVWPILFKKYGIKVSFLEKFSDIQSGKMKLFEKKFLHRK